MPNPTPSQRIVPDVGQSLTAQHLRHRKGPLVWPLWLGMLLFCALLAGAAVVLWLERERLLTELHRVSGEVSNVHARLDSGDTDVQDTIALVQAQMTTLFQEQEQLSVALINTREELYGALTDDEERPSNEMMTSFNQRLSQYQEQAALRDRRLAAFSTSLDALEQAGISGRQNLVEEVDHLEQTTAQQLTSLEEQANQLNQTVTGQLEEQIAALSERFNQLDTQLNTLQLDPSSPSDEIAAFEEQWTQRLSTLESDIRQIRQAQLAFSAQIEMLR
ncbi:MULTISPECIES: hypothetical protein [unclassified Halomonas]|uniref:hypothetical protein n=1 Tax=unclassified Halomonas TaxID=2609666 RepID=UPI004034AD79